MEQGVHRNPEKKRRRRRVIIGVSTVLLLVVVIVIIVFVVKKASVHTDKPRPSGLQSTFIERCEKFKGYDCEKLWGVFTQAFVGKDPCKVPLEAYDPLIAAAPFKPDCNRMMFWSKTKGVVHEFTEKRNCYRTLEDTLLGSVLDGLTWCGKEGSHETFTTNCPGWDDCKKNPVRSFWTKASAAFADVACGDVTAMLNGSIATPFSSQSIFGSVELKRFNATRVRQLEVVLVTQENAVTNCTDPSLKILQTELDRGIKYNCSEVTRAQLRECSSHPEKPCGPCW